MSILPLGSQRDSEAVREGSRFLAVSLSRCENQNWPEPRAIATVPVRDTSTRPRGSISAMNAFNFSLDPVISKTQLSVVEMTGSSEKLNAFIALMEPLGL